MNRIFSFFVALVLSLSATASSAEVKIQEVTSEGGITAWLVQENSIPFVALEIWFQGGASLDVPEKRGAINLMTALLEEGAADMDARAFAAARDSLAATIRFDVSDDSLQVSSRFLTENRDEALALLKTALTQPRFDQAAIDRVRKQVLSSIASEAQDPNSIAGNTFSALAHGDHPYATSSDGTAETVTALTRDDLLEAKARAMARDRVFVGVAGDISADELRPLLDELLGDLPAEGAPMPDAAPFNLSGGVTVVPFDVPQSVALFGHRGIEQDDEDFFAAFLLNTVLGANGFQSRLMSEVREKRGLTYGIGSFLVPKDHIPLYLGQVASANDRIAEAIEVTKSEWAKLAENGVTEDELTRAKTYLTGSYPLRFDGNGTIANIMVGMQLSDLPIDYIPTRNDQINAVTLDDVNRVARELLRPDDLHFVVVGQPVGLETTN
ncbi:pitrilysin family protein [Nereida sp. MMG025]|uniref:M16 family metallopeptidase n=1 Tax=Nereida sp. MMG025 TaxID=2909981 RepID=UPI001F1E9DDA|nr:pitrilysin family protein [Nereida sp. MMG025]MCF6444851.1 insulinase family protein [Nereida sp. MMG025]